MFRCIFLIFTIFFVLASAQGRYPPVAPKWGSYTFALSDNEGRDFAGGRMIYDYVAGYIRMESWDTPAPTPGINGITIWDLRAAQPVVWTIDDAANCTLQKLDDLVLAPAPLDFTGYEFSEVTYFNRALSEKWLDGQGGVVYVDLFSRDIVGLGNVSESEGAPFFQNILSWSDSKPGGNAFLIPKTIDCNPFGNTSEMSKRFSTSACNMCKSSIPTVLRSICNTVGTSACQLYAPAVPYCSTLRMAHCNGYWISASCACRMINIC